MSERKHSVLPGDTVKVKENKTPFEMNYGLVVEVVTDKRDNIFQVSVALFDESSKKLKGVVERERTKTPECVDMKKEELILINRREDSYDRDLYKDLSNV